MLADLDETIRQLLIQRVPLDASEVDVSFDAPDREWSSRLSRPTVNCFLYDVRENHELRNADLEKHRTTSMSVRRKPPMRIEATYQVTVWARVPEDEHRLLWRVLVALCKSPTIPAELLQDDLKNQPMPVPARVAQPDQMPQNYADLWQSLDNRIRPSLTYVVTLALDPDIAFSGPLVFTRTIRVQNQVSGEMSETFEIGGHVFQSESDASGVVGATVVLQETGDEATTDASGRFVFNRAPTGPITLVVRADGFSEVTRETQVPGPNYDVALGDSEPPASTRTRRRRGDND